MRRRPLLDQSTGATQRGQVYGKGIEVTQGQPMLEISSVMNSGVEEIFAFKTCCGARVFDQNLEILIKNRGARPVIVPSYCDLRGLRGTFRITTLMPPGEQTILPGGVKAFYCMMDEVTWRDARELVLYDSEGHAYAVDAGPQSQELTTSHG